MNELLLIWKGKLHVGENWNVWLSFGCSLKACAWVLEPDQTDHIVVLHAMHFKT